MTSPSQPSALVPRSDESCSIPRGWTAVVLVSPRDEYRVGDMGPLYAAMAHRAVESGARIALSTRYAGRLGNTFHLTSPAGPMNVKARFVVGADGARSRVARDLGLDRNRHLIIGAEEVFPLP
jgi:flavin-dependent dehydrogenase